MKKPTVVKPPYPTEFKKLSGKSSNAFCKGYFQHGNPHQVLRSPGENFKIFGQVSEVAQPGKSPLTTQRLGRTAQLSLIFLEMCNTSPRDWSTKVTAVPL